jgi:hypothetical protein
MQFLRGWLATDHNNLDASLHAFVAYAELGQSQAERTATVSSGRQRLAFLDTDPHGTATTSIDATTGTVTHRYSDPFGNSRGTPPAAWPSTHGYLNAPVDTSTGLTHLGARDYDPVLGRFRHWPGSLRGPIAARRLQPSCSLGRVAMRRFEPVATGLIRWRSPEEGGRTSGPPNGEQYAASAVFVLGGEADVLPGWPDTAERFSVGLNLIGHDSEWEPVEVDFLARDLVMDKLRPGVEILITEGARVVADLRITELVDSL